MRGLFITFEGTEASGKTTQIQYLVNRLHHLKRSVHVFRAPGGTEVGEEIRQVFKHGPEMGPKTELFLICASITQQIQEAIRPALERGDVVICDRFLDSTMAYQGYGRELDLHEVDRILDYTAAGVWPDRTLFLHVPLNISQLRREARLLHKKEEVDRIERSDPEFFLRVEEGFQCIAKRYAGRFRIIEANRSIDEVSSNIWVNVEDLFEEVDTCPSI